MEDLSIDSSIIGTQLPDFGREITMRETMNYAAAVGDENPCYLDDSNQKEGIVAPPMFAAAFTWPVVEGFQQHLNKHLPAEVLGRVVHAAEYLSFSRPVKPGDRLHAKAEVVSVEQVSAGTLAVLGINVMDHAENPVFHEEAWFLFRGVALRGPGRTRQAPASWPEPGKEGPVLWKEDIHVSRSAPWIYDGCTNIVFPIHTSVDFARRMGLPDVILQGTAALALAAREILNDEAGAQPEALKKLACKFTGMVIPETYISLQVIKKDENSSWKSICFRVLDSRGKPVLSSGYACIKRL